MIVKIKGFASDKVAKTFYTASRFSQLNLLNASKNLAFANTMAP